MTRHFVDLFDISPDEARGLLDLASRLKGGLEHGVRPPLLAGRLLGLIFDKPSLRTRVSFEAAMVHLGGQAIFMQGKEIGLGVRESVEDFARVTSQYVDALAIRTFAQATVDQLAAYAHVPVINALSDSAHPCQAMADALTIREAFGADRRVHVVFVGDGNNVAASLAVACELLGHSFKLVCPPEYDFPADFRTRFSARFPGAKLESVNDPRSGVAGADVIYTDVWTSMGQEDESDRRRKAFAAYQVDDSLMARAGSDAVFLHCLPAHRGEEVSASVIDGPRSLILPQAANRLHFQKALLAWLITGRLDHEVEAPDERNGQSASRRLNGPARGRSSTSSRTRRR